MKPVYVECSSCKKYHNVANIKECNENEAGYTKENLDKKYGNDNWTDISLEKQIRSS